MYQIVSVCLRYCTYFLFFLIHVLNLKGVFLKQKLEWVSHNYFKRLNLGPFQDVTLIQNKAIGTAWSHFECVSWHIFARVFLIVWFIFSVSKMQVVSIESAVPVLSSGRFLK